jgi:hypothetical protein
MSTSNEGRTHQFKDKEDFNNLLSPIIDDAFGEYEKIAGYFTSITKASGPDTFLPTLVVFNSFKKLSAVMTARPIEDKDDMYKVLAQMMVFPATINSNLFILAQDSRVRVIDNKTQVEEVSDGLIVTFVTSETCTIFTIPYTVDDDNNVTYVLEKAWLTEVTEDAATSSNNSIGKMVELLYIFSHAPKPPMSVDEILSFYNDNGFAYQIIDEQNLSHHPLAFPVKLA